LKAGPSAKTDSDPAELFPARKQLADRFFEVHLANQRDWYGRNARRNKRNANLLAFLILLCGVVISVMQVFEGWSWLPFATAVLGALVAIAKGLERIGKYEETWIGYRKASEAMKREYRLFINNAGNYADADNENQAYRWFVEAVERIIAEEQNQFWGVRTTPKKSGKSEER
jgi:hypothetical protein